MQGVLIDPGLLGHDGSAPLGLGSAQPPRPLRGLAVCQPLKREYEPSITVVAGHAVVTETSVKAGHRRIVSDAMAGEKVTLTCRNTGLSAACGQ